MISTSTASLLSEDFEELALVGRGGHGSVFRGRDAGVGRVVAVKVLHSGASEDRAGQEAEAQAAVSHHDHILTLYDTGTTSDGHPYLVLEYAAGGSLQDRVEQEGPLDGRTWHRLGAELATALASARAEGVAHCDVKPSNVLFTAEGAVRLADFGIARSVGVTADTLDHFRGSIAYTAPEVLDGEQPGFPGDVYSLALTMWFAAMGRHPFGADTTAPAALVARIQTETVDFDDLPFPVATDLRRALDRAVRRDPADRPDAADLLSRFRHQPVVLAAERPRARRRWTLPLVAVLAALVGSGSTLLIAPGSTEEAERPQTAAVTDRARFCTVFAQTMTARTRLLGDVSNDLEQSASPTRVVRSVLEGYPQESAEILLPFVEEWRRFSGAPAPEMSSFTLSQLSLAEALRPLTGGKVFLDDSEDGSFDPRTIPTELRVPALTLSEAFRSGAETCGAVDTDLGAEKARMSSAVFSTLTDDRFLADFFEDPESARLMTTPTVLLITSMSWGFTEALLVSHLDWFFQVLEGDDELLSAVAFEHPDIILAAVLNEPALAPYITTPRWSAHLQLGIEHATPSEKAGMQQLYGPQLQMIGMADR